MSPCPLNERGRRTRNELRITPVTNWKQLPAGRREEKQKRQPR